MNANNKMNMNIDNDIGINIIAITITSNFNDRIVAQSYYSYEYHKYYE